MKIKRTFRNIILFTIVVVLSGWIGIIVDKFIPGQPEGDSLGMGIWLVLPLLAVIVLRTFAGDGWKDIPTSMYLLAGLCLRKRRKNIVKDDLC
jgi:hypothetical protein